MKKLLLIACCTFSVGAWANEIECNKLAQIAKNNGAIYKYSLTVQGKKGFRTYFHSAPSSKCKIKNLFLIPNDSVNAYQAFDNEGVEWINIMYIDKKGNYPDGWVKAKDFKISGRYSPNNLTP